ncbi:unnamed protein product [Rhizophagus irregularis]|uniref:Uncharacterized protein n=1 Tax=Rhizophagus irregularis TaxID=588596 RepID=A0A915ZBE7_9GLOM|nr:unnamed protein product [Rhizophagus irregularis]CAB5368379.1 unnamed protein product [Rhizophagus irregularis]
MSHNQNVKLFFAISNTFAVPVNLIYIGSRCVYFFVVLAKPLGESSAVHITEENNTIDGKTLHENDLTTFELKKLIWKELVGNEEGSNKANQWTLWKVEDFIEALQDIEDSNTETFIKHNSMVKSYGP